LILNARDAMPEGGLLRITVGRETTPDPRLPWGVMRHPERYAHMVVSDTGCGMGADTLRHIFEPLYTTKKNGTGLGLSVVHQVVMRHAGEIFVESAPGAGTSFHIFLPLAAAAETRTTAAAPEQAWTAPPASRILLVEDDESVAGGLQALLSLEGIDVVIATTGADAIRAVVREEFDLVVLDVGLPDMEGTNVYSAIAAMRPELPVIFSTGHGDRSKLELATARANVGFLLKPYDCDVLLATMREVTRGSAGVLAG
ncbi:MAG TPA: response regulator, partial [Thermoanaerobaculia bacterium]|nr:response regulator [Thermoanaerobaculia bacterium]